MCTGDFRALARSPNLRDNRDRTPLSWAAENASEAIAQLLLENGATVDAIAFRVAGQKLGIALRDNRGRQVHAAGTFALDRWQGRERVQFKLTDIAPAEPFTGR